uniref:Uncharacterized protein n=1 Tax=Sphaerodactylus townsendi TaxID=933632 RepID=A0ACB8ES43_9SAUR
MSGFLKPLEEEIFAAVNSTAMLSYELNFDPRDEKYINSIEVHQTQETLGKPISPNSNGSCPSRNISEVQFEDAGWYRCHLNVNRQSLNKTIHLVVMKGHLPKKGEMNLCCNISSPLPPGARLRWGAVDESVDTPHCLVIRTAGLWTCSLIVEEEVKISMNYTVGTIRRE